MLLNEVNQSAHQLWLYWFFILFTNSSNLNKNWNEHYSKLRNFHSILMFNGLQAALCLQHLGSVSESLHNGFLKFSLRLNLYYNQLCFGSWCHFKGVASPSCHCLHSQPSSTPRVPSSPCPSSHRYQSLKMEGNDYRWEDHCFQRDPDSFEAPPSTWPHPCLCHTQSVSFPRHRFQTLSIETVLNQNKFA